MPDHRGPSSPNEEGVPGLISRRAFGEAIGTAAIARSAARAAVGERACHHTATTPFRTCEVRGDRRWTLLRERH